MPTFIKLNQQSQWRWKSIAAKLAQTLVTALGASILIWALLPLAPGDAALRTLQALGNDNPRPAEVEALRRELKLDRPLPAQYLAWLGRAVRGDLSVSFQSGRPVTLELGRRLPATAMLASVALAISIALALGAALTSAAFVGRWPDKLIRAATQLGASLPGFLLGLLALYFIVIGAGFGRVVASGEWRDVWLPAICLAVGRASNWTQLLRAGLLEALGARFTMVAAARGATRLRVLLRYALPNALPPFLVMVGVGVGSLLGGAAIIETVFSWPGVGSYVVTAITARDLPVIQGFVVISTLTFIVANFLADVTSAMIDPRLRETGLGKGVNKGVGEGVGKI